MDRTYPTTESQALSLRDLLSTLFIYKSLIIFLIALFGGGALVISYLQPEIYEASVQIWAQDQSAGLRRTSDYTTETAARIKVVLTNLREVILSRQVLESTLDRCGLLEASSGPERHQRSRRSSQEEQIQRMRRAIRLEAPKGSDFGTTQIFFLRVRDRDPNCAKQLLEALVESFRKRHEQLSAEQAKHLFAETSRQVEGSREQLQVSEEKLDAFVAQLGAGFIELNAMTSSNGGESDLRKGLSSVTERLVPTRAELLERVSFFDQLQKARASSLDLPIAPSVFVRDYPALEQAARVLGEIRLQADGVAARNTPEHPEYQIVQERLASARRAYGQELDNALRAMQREIGAKQQAVDFLTEQKDGYVEHLASLAGQYVTYEGLREDIRQKRTIVEDTEKRRSDAAHALVTAAQEILLSTIDPPRSGSKPVSPNRTLNALVGTLLGLVIGVGLAFLAQQYSHAVRTEADLAGLTNDLLVVSIPKVRAPVQKAG